MTTLEIFASDKQINFIKSLLTEREISLQDRDELLRALSSMEKKQASLLIDTLLKLPKRSAKITFVETKKSPLQEALASAPKSKYAVPAEDVDINLTNTNINGDILFVEVKEYMGNLYMRRLLGSLGGFTRYKVDNSDAVEIMKVIATDPYKYARKFGEVYSCCGSCGAELTDPVSRSLQLGPECRKKFGK